MTPGTTPDQRKMASCQDRSLRRQTVFPKASVNLSTIVWYVLKGDVDFVLPPSPSHPPSLPPSIPPSIPPSRPPSIPQAHPCIRRNHLLSHLRIQKENLEIEEPWNEAPKQPTANPLPPSAKSHGEAIQSQPVAMARHPHPLHRDQTRCRMRQKRYRTNVRR